MSRFALLASLLIVVALLAACGVRLPGQAGPATKAPTPMPPSSKSATVAPTKAVVAPTQAPAAAAPTVAPAAGPSQPVTATTTMTVALEGPLWKLVSYLDSKGQTVPALAGSEVTAQFQDGKIAGKDGCNQYTGTYKVTGGVLTVKLGASTLMACEAKLMDQAKAYTAALSSAATFQITGDRLQITNGGGKVAATFAAPAPAAGPAPAVAATQAPTQTAKITTTAAITIPLEGTAWKLTALADAQGTAAPALAGTEITALLQGGRVTGSAGCNNYSATYKATAAALTVNAPVATTRKACPQPTMRQETAYLAALAKSATFKIEGDKLELRNAAGALLASFAAPKPAAAATALPAPAKPVTPTIAIAPTKPVTPTIVIAPTKTITPTVAPTPTALPKSPAQLTNTLWQWVRFVTPMDVKDVPNPGKYAVVFKADGKVEITADCNKAAGTYKLQGSRIQVQIGPSTLAACPPGSMADQFLANLGSATLHFLDGDALYIELFADSGVMKFANGGPVK
jgi:heat shock protein HslJ